MPAQKQPGQRAVSAAEAELRLGRRHELLGLELAPDLATESWGKRLTRAVDLSGRLTAASIGRGVMSRYVSPR